jgi:hypothetical protein
MVKTACARRPACQSGAARAISDNVMMLTICGDLAARKRSSALLVEIFGREMPA